MQLNLRTRNGRLFALIAAMSVVGIPGIGLCNLPGSVEKAETAGSAESEALVTSAALPEDLHPRAILISFDPIMEDHSNRRLHEVFGWSDALPLTDEYILDLLHSSHGLLDVVLTQAINVDVHPIKLDGFRYDDSSYYTAWTTRTFHDPDNVDYRAVARDYDLARKVDYGIVDEVFMHGAPAFGYWESTMAGRGGYWCNSGPVARVPSSKIFIMMGFNYERGVAEMLHSNGHRSESILSETFGGWDITKSRTDWERFTHNTFQSGDAACGSIHYPPNGEADYDYANPRTVMSTANDWLNNFPNLTGASSPVDRESWGGPDYHRTFMNWWYEHLPHVDGMNNHDGLIRLNNWWPYLFDLNSYEESGGDHVRGGSPPSALRYPGLVLRATSNSNDDWRPQANAAGQVVWYGHDGVDFEIYTVDRTRAVRRITKNFGIDDEAPRINKHGRIVWQAFDGQDYEIFSCNFDGSDLVQITDNVHNDWHAEINDNNVVVWDGFDGNDYEIYSANADGSNVVQVTDNDVANGYPREDVWPQINNIGRIVWSGFDGWDWEIFSANRDGSDLQNLSNSVFDEEYPQINDANNVVWHAWATNENCEIYTTQATGGSLTRLSLNPTEDWHPRMNERGAIVWMAHDGNDWEIYAKLPGQNPRAITNNDTHDQYPVIDEDNRISWQGFDGNDWEIYRWGMERTFQVTDNDVNDRAPECAARRITVWHADHSTILGRGTSDIHVAVDPF
jgi:hypothetical protein